MSAYNWNHSPMQFMIYSNKTHLIINVIGLPYIKRVRWRRHWSKQQNNKKKTLSIVKANDLARAGTKLYPIIDRTWTVSPRAWYPITVIFSTNHKIPIHSGQISFLVDQFSHCLFVHNKIHKIGESCKLGNGNDFLTALATPLSSTAHFSCWASSRQMAHKSGKLLRLAKNRRVLPQLKKNAVSINRA